MSFASNAGLVADMQAWVDSPATNFGWILISESEETSGTARRFGARENGSTAPALVVTFTPGTTQAPPTLTGQPQDQSVFVGETATFSVTADGTAPLQYQWSLNLTNLPGANTATLTLNNAQATNAGTYSVTVTNAAGSKASDSAKLTVAPGPLLGSPTVSGGVVTLIFEALPKHNYEVQFLPSLLTGNWQTFTNVPAPPVSTNIVLSDPASASQRFYRLKTTQVQ
jgi:hypothetical protein